jgi:FMN phosphatase YigB (HAD superfamily)
LSPIKGILFDVDGTLYYQLPLRMIMILILVFEHFGNLKELCRKIRVILQYRKAQEILRNSYDEPTNCSKLQIKLTANKTGESYHYVRSIIAEWFEKKPLDYINLCRRRGLKRFIGFLQKEGFKLGVFSDYPAIGKLKALGICDYFPTIIDPCDLDIKGFKPNTNGFEIAAQKMSLPPSEILYIGDRSEVDGIGASLAGMPVIILNRFSLKKSDQNYVCMKSFNGILKQVKPSNSNIE